MRGVWWCFWRRGCSTPRAQAAERRADVVVYGATASGVIAVVVVAREGKSVLLRRPATARRRYGQRRPRRY
ncbi:MAG: hypothetical protein U0736_00865 [Gemmataceae bacterium]